MKKLFVLLLAASLAFSLAACGKKDTPAASSAAGTSVSASASESAAVSSSAAASPSAGQSSSAKAASQSVQLPTVSVSVPSGAHTVTGTVQAVGMSAMTITTDAGQEVSFSHEGVANMPNLVEGDRVTITYAGTLDNADVYAVEKA